MPWHIDPVNIDVENHDRNRCRNDLPQKLDLRAQGNDVVRNADNDQERSAGHDADHLIRKTDRRDRRDHEARVNRKASEPGYQPVMHLPGVRLVYGSDADGEVLHDRRQYERDGKRDKKRERISEQRNTS